MYILNFHKFWNKITVIWWWQILHILVTLKFRRELFHQEFCVLQWYPLIDILLVISWGIKTFLVPLIKITPWIFHNRNLVKMFWDVVGRIYSFKVICGKFLEFTAFTPLASPYLSKKLQLVRHFFLSGFFRAPSLGPFFHALL